MSYIYSIFYTTSYSIIELNNAIPIINSMVFSNEHSHRRHLPSRHHCLFLLRRFVLILVTLILMDNILKTNKQGFNDAFLIKIGLIRKKTLLRFSAFSKPIGGKRFTEGFLLSHEKFLLKQVILIF